VNELITTFIILFMSISTLEMDKVVVPSKALVIIQFDLLAVMLQFQSVYLNYRQATGCYSLVLTS